MLCMRSSTSKTLLYRFQPVDMQNNMALVILLSTCDFWLHLQYLSPRLLFLAWLSVLGCLGLRHGGILLCWRCSHVKARRAVAIHAMKDPRNSYHECRSLHKRFDVARLVIC